VRVAVTPEEIGLVGCWQVIAVRRESFDLAKKKERDEVGYYTSSLTLAQYDDEGIGTLIRNHWSAIENGTHYRRDVTLGEDACRTRGTGAEVLASLRNLTNGIYEIERAQEGTKVDSLKSWCQQQTFSTAWSLLVGQPESALARRQSLAKERKCARVRATVRPA